MTGFFIITTIICAIGWYFNSVSSKAIGHYVREKGYDMPTDEEINACIKWAVKNFFKW